MDAIPEAPPVELATEEQRTTEINLEAEKNEVDDVEKKSTVTFTEEEDSGQDEDADDKVASFEKPKKEKIKYHLKDALKNRFTLGKISRPKDLEKSIEMTLSDDSELSVQMEPNEFKEDPEEMMLEAKDLQMSLRKTIDSSISLFDEEPDTLLLKAFYLDNMDRLPSLSDLTDEDSDTELAIEAVTTKLKSYVVEMEEGADVGKFVDPLTGEALEETSSSSSTPSVAAETVEELKYEESDASFEVDDDIDVKDKLSDEEGAIEGIFRGTAAKWDEIVRSEEMNEIKRQKAEVKQIVITFLSDVIKDVIHFVEYVDPKSVLASKLDKRKLIHELKSVIGMYMNEKQYNIALNTKICDYYRRNKVARAYAVLPYKEDAKERIRYEKALQLIDHSRKIMNVTKRQNAFLMSSVLMDLNYIQNIAMTSEIVLEDCIRGTIIRKESEHLKRITERELRLMKIARNEISDTRQFLITRQHTLGRLDDQIMKIEQISETLTMTKFLALQNEIQAIYRKLEERNNDLKKQRSSYQHELHDISHVREKIISLKHSLTKANQIYVEKGNYKIKLRERLYKLKLERGVIRRETRNTTFKGGLLAIPLLMFDYDETLEKVLVKRVTVAKLKQTMKNLLQRIADAEKSHDSSVL